VTGVTVLVPLVLLGLVPLVLLGLAPLLLLGLVPLLLLVPCGGSGGGYVTAGLGEGVELSGLKGGYLGGVLDGEGSAVNVEAGGKGEGTGPPLVLLGRVPLLLLLRRVPLLLLGGRVPLVLLRRVPLLLLLRRVPLSLVVPLSVLSLVCGVGLGLGYCREVGRLGRCDLGGVLDRGRSSVSMSSPLSRASPNNSQQHDLEK
jgi:hypothetical protein